MGRLSEIKTEIGALLSAITISNGFSFDFGTLNQPDRAKIVDFPGANIKIKSEQPSSKAAAHHGFDACQVEIEIFCNMTLVNTTPVQFIDDEYDVVVTAIKDKFHAKLGCLPLTRNAVLEYRGFRKTPSQSGDVFAPDRCFVDCEVTYNSNEETLS